MHFVTLAHFMDEGALAKEGNLSFTMDSYDEATGSAQYHFTVK